MVTWSLSDAFEFISVEAVAAVPLALDPPAMFLGGSFWRSWVSGKHRGH